MRKKKKKNQQLLNNVFSVYSLCNKKKLLKTLFRQHVGDDTNKLSNMCKKYVHYVLLINKNAFSQ
jgi:hypothetical protein